MNEIATSLPRCLKLSFPPVTIQLVQELLKPASSFESIAKVISLDPVLAASVMALVNSPFYGLREEVTNLQRAAIVLGTQEILKLALSVSFQKSLGAPDDGQGSFPSWSNWRPIVWSAIAAELLANRLCPSKADRAYLCTLLKDLSLLLLNSSMPKILQRVLREAPNGLIVCHHPDQDEAERRCWGMTHGALSLAILEEWDFPLDSCQCIRHHHDFEGLDDHPPLTQAVILATRWSELELDCSTNPYNMVRLEMLLKERLNMSSADVEEMRAECIRKFKSMLDALGIEEGDPKTRNYQCPLAAMQRFYFMGADLMDLKGGLTAVAKVVARHLKWTFGIKTWDLALREPERDGWTIFHARDGLGVEYVEPAPEGFTPAGDGGSTGISLTASDTCWGELHVPSDTPPEMLDELRMYARFLSQAFEHYALRLALLEVKARTLDVLPVGVARLDENGRVLEANERLKSLLAEDSLAGRDIWQPLASRHGILRFREWDAFLADKNRSFTSKIFCAGSDLDGSGLPRDACFYVSAHRMEHEGRTEILFLMEDVTEISDLELQSLKQHEFLERLVDSMQDMVATVDRRGRVDYASPRYAGLLGTNLFQSSTPTQSFVGKWGPEVLDHPPESVEVVLSLDGQAKKPLELVISPLTSRHAYQQTSYLVVGRDLTAVRRLEDKLKRQAIYDSLTELYNRHQFHALLEREIERSRRTGAPMGIVFFDLDDFKSINDTKGHQAGDEILHGVGKALKQMVRRGTDFPCRFGGDEFVILFSETAPERLFELCERIRSKIKAACPMIRGVSAGMAVLSPADTAERLLRRVDRALYSAKAEGGGRSIWAADEP